MTVADSRWLAHASAEDVRNIARALATSPHAQVALTELLTQADVVGTFYSRDDIAANIAARIDAIEDALGHPLSDAEFETITDNAWTQFATGSVPMPARDAFCEELYGAIWDQVGLLAGRDAHTPKTSASSVVEPATEASEMVNHSTPPAPKATPATALPLIRSLSIP